MADGTGLNNKTTAAAMRRETGAFRPEIDPASGDGPCRNAVQLTHPRVKLLLATGLVA